MEIPQGKMLWKWKFQKNPCEQTGPTDLPTQMWKGGINLAIIDRSSWNLVCRSLLWICMQLKHLVTIWQFFNWPTQLTKKLLIAKFWKCYNFSIFDWNCIKLGRVTLDKKIIHMKSLLEVRPAIFLSYRYSLEKLWKWDISGTVWAIALIFCVGAP